MSFFPFESIPALAKSAHCRLAWGAAAIAGTMIREGFLQAQPASQKYAGDLVLPLDCNIDAEVRKLLAESAPKDSVVSEEGKTIHGKSGLTWIVDPLDGTTAFYYAVGGKMPSFMIALKDSRQTILGLVHLPLVGMTYLALRSHGSYMQDMEGQVGQIQASAQHTPPLENAWVEANRYSDAEYETNWFRDTLRGLRSPRGAGLVTSQAPHSAISCAMIGMPLCSPSAVIHDNNPTMVKQAQWDLAAPAIIVEEAGGVVVNGDLERVDPFGTPQPVIFSRSIGLAKEIVNLAR